MLWRDMQVSNKKVCSHVTRGYKSGPWEIASRGVGERVGSREVTGILCVKARSTF